MKVLIVDDSPAVCDRLVSLLANFGGIEVVGQAHSVPEAVEALQTCSPDAVILDIQLPGGSGFDVLSAIKQRRPRPLTIMLTNAPEPQYRERSLKEGADLFFDKSTEFTKVDEVLSAYRQRLLAPPSSASAIGEEEALQQRRIGRTEEPGALAPSVDVDERSEQGQALLASEERFRAIFETAAIGIGFTDLEGRIVESNAALQRMLGYSREELQGKVFTELTHPDNRSQNVELFVDLLTGERTQYQIESRYLRKDGEVFEGRLIVSLVQKDGNEARFAVILMEDITERLQHEAERKRIEELLRQSEERYALAVRGANDGLWDWNLLTNEVYFSPRWKSMLGYEEHEIRNHFDEWEQRIHPDDRERAQAALQDHFAGRTPLYEFEHRLLHKDGTYRWIVARGVCVRDEQGKPYRMAGSHTDITARKLREEALQEEIRISSTLVRVGRELTSSLNTSTILTRLCQLVTEALGCECTQVVFWQPYQKVYTPVASYGDAPEQWAVLKTARISREAIAELPARFERADVLQVVTAAHPEWLPAVFLQQVGVRRALWAPLRRGQELIGALSAGYRQGTAPFTSTQERLASGIAHIASLALENARLVEELEQANRLKMDFLATISHELRTPLNIIMGYTELLLDGDFGPLSREQIDSLRQVNKSAGCLLEILTATLEASQLAAGQTALTVEAIPLAELLATLRRDTERRCDERGLRLLWRVAPDLPIIHTDWSKLETVIKHLLHNAIKFTAQGSITVDVHSHNGGLEVTVADTGIGIAPEVLPVIFDLLRQGDSSATRRHGGVGLGLYIVRQLVNLLGGTITVESEPGRGATFRVWTPETPRGRR
ncbi:MAG TPA: PAS domain S-box protein [Methylomirabilota bacterium]|nr:PAS domain S-box protein [Methylomirabilota bacterium]